MSKTDNEIALGSDIFNGCKELKSVNVQCGFISQNMFKDCQNVNYVNFDNNTKKGLIISENAFQNCTSIEQLKFHSGTVQIGNMAFYNCTSLTSVEFENPGSINQVNALGNDIFGGSKIRSISFPSSLTSLAFLSENTLGNLERLTDIYFDGIKYEDLITESQVICSEFDPNVWLVNNRSKFSGFSKITNVKQVGYAKQIEAYKFADERGIPIIVLSLCNGCGYSTDLANYVRSEKFVSWMKSLNKNYMCIAMDCYEDTNNYSNFYWWFRKNVKQKQGLSYKIPNYSFDGDEDVGSRCGKIFVMHGDSYRYGFVPQRKGSDRSSQVVKIRQGGESYSDCKNKVDLFEVLNDRVINQDWSSYQSVDFGGRIQKQEINNGIVKTHCFGLNHDVTIHSSDGKTFEYKE